jgi:glucose dehydrogenase
MVTRAGLIFVAGDNPVLYALDTRDGRVLWEGALGGEGFGSPMTYRTVSGRQFVVVAVGRRDARLKAFALSEPATPPR